VEGMEIKEVQSGPEAATLLPGTMLSS